MLNRHRDVQDKQLLSITNLVKIIQFMTIIRVCFKIVVHLVFMHTY